MRCNNTLPKTFDDRQGARIKKLAKAGTVDDFEKVVCECPMMR